MTFQSTTIWNAVSTIYQVINLQKSRHISPQATLPQSFIGQYTLIIDETQLIVGIVVFTMVKTYAKRYAKFRKFMLVKKTAICSCKNFADFQHFQPRISLPLNFKNFFLCIGSWVSLVHLLF